MSSELYLNRELSWLDFNARVMALAEQSDIPLMERVRFLAIWANNFDEFFMVRVAGLMEQIAHGVRGSSADGMSATEQLVAIRSVARGHYERASRLFTDELAPGLAKSGILLSDYAALDGEDREYVDRQFRDRIFPVVTPLAVDPSHPFPYISNLSLNLALIVRNPDTNVTRFARIKVPPILPRFLVMPDGERFIPLENVIAAHAGELFPGMEIVEHHAFRVTRNADLEIEEDQGGDLLQTIESELTRRRFGRVVRLEVHPSMSEEVLDLLKREMDLEDDGVVVVDGPLDMAGLFVLCDLERPELFWEAWQWVTQPRLASPVGEPVDMFATIRDGDVLVQHPYDSFTTSVEAFIARAARDPNVLAIKQTLYRTSKDSPIMKALMEAATEGKQVVALVELKARFDEERNIEWAQRLEDAGVHVVYGVVGLKTHTKIALGGSRRGRRLPAVRTHRDGELQRFDCPHLRGHRVVHRRPRDRCRPHGPLQLPHRLRPSKGVPEASRVSCDGTVRTHGCDPRRGIPSGRAHHHEDELARRRRNDRRALRGFERRMQDRVDRSRNLLPHPGSPRNEREHHSALPCRPLPGALAGLPLRGER